MKKNKKEKDEFKFDTTSIADLEAQKLKELQKVFDSIITSQKIRIDNKSLEIKQLKNTLKTEQIELDNLKNALGIYVKQVTLFKDNLKAFEENSSEINRNLNARLQQAFINFNNSNNFGGVDYVG